MKKKELGCFLFSMIAEIGGYAGLMIGFSILDFVVACQIVASISKIPKFNKK